MSSLSFRMLDQTGHFRASQTESPDKIRLIWLYVIEHNKIHTKVKLFMR